MPSDLRQQHRLFDIDLAIAVHSKTDISTQLAIIATKDTRYDLCNLHAYTTSTHYLLTDRDYTKSYI